MSSPIQLPALPYAESDLAPVISANTIGFHYGKHHSGYVDKLNGMIGGTDFADMKLEEIVKSSAGKPDKAGVFNNAAQIYNHTFYWNSLKPGGGGKPGGAIAGLIDDSFGGYDKFKEEFANAAATQFGSGWAWLVKDGSKLKIVKTANAETPLTTSAKPVLTLDVWEHAYYLDYQNKRPAYIDAVIDKLLNWDFANQNIG